MRAPETKPSNDYEQKLVSKPEIFGPICDRAMQIIRKINVFNRTPINENSDWNIGSHRYLAFDSIYNTYMSKNQLAMALAICKSPKVDEMLNDSRDNKDGQLLEKLIEAKPLRGMKILDLGCGEEPVIARIFRALGAEVYTVDIKSSDKLRRQKQNVYSELEVSHHIQIDINRKGAEWEIMLKTKDGEFDFVTESHLSSAGGETTPELIYTLLKPGGVYFDADKFSPKGIKVKE